MLKWLVPIALGAFIVAAYPSAVGDIAREAKEENNIRLLFVGDIFFDRSIRTVMRERGDDFPLSCVAERLHEYDLVVGNLEGPITAFSSVAEGSAVGSPENFQFTFPTSTAAALQRANIQLVNLGNNHIGNFGREGMEMTKRHLNAASVRYFGGQAMDIPIYRYISDDRELSFVSYNEFGGLSVASTTELIAREEKEGRMVFVYAHWGEEYQPPPAHVRAAARAFIDAGASAVFGSHPHVVLEKEVYEGRPVYYSLGNFLFDQYWNREVRNGLAVEISLISGGKIAVHELPIEIMRVGRVCFVDSTSAIP
jgi:poly-gamma-glutamate synthesis protein (capsule biosynthesis protein)